MMLQSIRDRAGSWFIKVLLGAIIASFAFFGIGDIINSHQMDKVVATVDGAKISLDAFSHSQKELLAQIQRASKEPLSQEMIKQLNIHDKALERLINQKVLENAKSTLGLVASNKTIAQFIQTIPDLQTNGSFNKEKFQTLLQRNQMSEAQLTQEMRNNLINLQFSSPFLHAFQLPKYYVNLLFQALTEEKIFTLLPIPFSKITPNLTASREELKIFYENNKANFARPEYREINVLKMDHVFISNKINIPENQLREEYQKRIAEFTQSEKRGLHHIQFISQDAAKKALQSMNKGRPASAAARDEEGVFTNLGLVEKNQLEDDLKDDLFSMDMGQPSRVISKGLSWSIYVVTSIHPEKVQSFEEVKKTLEDGLKAELLSDKVYEWRTKIEDMLSAGSELPEIAKELQMTLLTYDAFDKNGLNTEGKSALPENMKDSVIKVAFETSANQSSQFTDLKDGEGYVLFVNKVIPPYQPNFEEIEKTVNGAWREEKQFEEAAKLAQKIAESTKTVGDLEKNAATNKLITKTLSPLSRSTAEKDVSIRKELSPQILKKIFALKVGQAAYGQTRNGFVVVVLDKALPFDAETKKDKSEKITNGLQSLSSKDVEKSMLLFYRDKADVVIDQKVMDACIATE